MQYRARRYSQDYETTGGPLSGDEAARPRTGGRRWLLAIYATVFALFGLVVWFAWEETLGGVGAPRLVQAPEGPLKLAPDEPGGLPVENENASVVRVFGSDPQLARVEKVLPKPPPPARAALEADPSLAEPSRAPAVLPKPLLAPELSIAMKPTPGEQPSSASAENDGGVEATLAAVASEASDGASETAPASSDHEAVAMPPPPKPKLPTQLGLSEATAEPTALGGDPVPYNVASSSQVPAPLYRTGGNAASTGSGDPATQKSSVGSQWRIQVAALHSKDAALEAWNRIRGRYPSILGSRDVALEEVAVGAGIFYRVQASGFADREAAALACEQIRQAGGDCFVVGARL